MFDCNALYGLHSQIKLKIISIIKILKFYCYSIQLMIGSKYHGLIYANKILNSVIAFLNNYKNDEKHFSKNFNGLKKFKLCLNVAQKKKKSFYKIFTK